MRTSFQGSAVSPLPSLTVRKDSQPSLFDGVSSQMCTSCFVFVLLLLTFIGLIVAASIPEWLEGEIKLKTFDQSKTVTFERRWGVYSSCGRLQKGTEKVNFDCENSRFTADKECQDSASIFVVMQSLIILAIVFIGLALFILPCAMYMRHGLSIGFAMIFCILGFLFSLVVVICFAAGPYDTTYSCVGTEQPTSQDRFLCPDCALGAGWILTLIASILSLAVLIFTCVAFGCWQRADEEASAEYVVFTPSRNAMSPRGSPTGVYVGWSPSGRNPRAKAHMSPAPVRARSGMESPMIDMGFDGVPSDPLLMRCEQVKLKLRRTLAEDIERTVRLSPSPLLG